SDGRARPPIVVLDEAYIEFAGPSLVALRARHANLVIVRTLSKAYALAGFRVGFAMADRATIAQLAIYRPPGSISSVSAAVGEAGLRNPAALAANVRAVTAERDRLAGALRATGWPVATGVANFLLVDFGSPEAAAAVATGLLRAGLVPRTFGAEHPLAGHLRITVRTPAQDDRLVAVAARLRAEPS
ncbi:MAG: aminotransferase class I/II-fold pyridoxal phosphate-dependent enzyme, partial [Candidatus Limnocylindrales bacterium]